MNRPVIAARLGPLLRAGLPLLVAAAAWAAPFVPKDDAEVLERLPVRAADPVARELRELRAANAVSPGDAAAAARLARRYFDLAMAEGDPRYIGYAQAALAPIPLDEGASAELWLLRGLLRQYGHDFEGALQDLGRALQADPDYAEARSWRAALHMVRADYAKAREECAALRSRRLMGAGCAAYVDAASGRLAAAYAALGDALARSPGASAEQRLWVLTRLAEFAQRQGKPAEAEAHFRAALALGLTDGYLLAAYADFLLEQGRPGEVLELLKGWERSDILLLRLALAAQAAKSPALGGYVSTLRERFAAAGLRGDKTHQQEEARLRLFLLGDVQGALRLAQENYRVQREPRDAEILLLAARAAKSPDAAQPALDWLAQSGFEDSRLARLAEDLRGMVAR